MRLPVVLFPPQDNLPWIPCDGTLQTEHNRRLTIVLLDGSWRQAKKMIRTSAWLQHLPLLAISPEKSGAFTVRRSGHAHLLSTAEALSCAIGQLGEIENAQILDDYFLIFNAHCAATRASMIASCDSPMHQRMYVRRRLMAGLM